jgi:hypothetical protein
MVKKLVKKKKEPGRGREGVCTMVKLRECPACLPDK